MRLSRVYSEWFRVNSVTSIQSMKFTNIIKMCDNQKT